MKTLSTFLILLLYANVAFGASVGGTGAQGPAGPAGTPPAGAVNTFQRNNAGAFGEVAGVTSTGSGMTVDGVPFDASNASETRPFKAGTLAARPATCNVKAVYFATDVTAGLNIYLCTVTDVWTAIAFAPPGLNTRVIFNDNDVLTGIASFTVDKVTGIVTAGGFVSTGDSGWTQWITGDMPLSASSSIRCGSDTGNIWMCSINGGAKFAAPMGAPTDDSILIGNGTLWQLKALPSCSNATTSKLLYDISTNTISCGTDQNTGSINGSGTDGTIVRFSGGTTTLGNSSITDNGTLPTLPLGSLVKAGAGSGTHKLSGIICADPATVTTVGTVEVVVRTCPILANSLSADAKTLRVTVLFNRFLGNSNSTTARIRWGGLTGSICVAKTMTSASDISILTCTLMRRAVASQVMLGTAAPNVAANMITTYTVATLDETASNDLVVTLTTPIAAADGLIQMFLVEYLN